MSNFDYTLTSPLFFPASELNPLLVITIAWHPDSQRIGEQFMGTTEASLVELNRFHPLFKHFDSEALGIGYSGISREPVRIVRNSNNDITITPPNSRMVVEINGEQILGPITLSKEQIDAGLILGLGRTVLLCFHWMRCLPKQNPVKGFLGIGEAAVRTRDLIRQAATTDSAVLLLGETGTGKEVAAQAIHALSKRSQHKITSINMAALNESLAAADLFGAVKGAYTGAQTTRAGLFSEAQNSTLFLDEIGNTPATIQPMLLRVLESGEYRPLGAQKDSQSSARLITATDQDLYDSNFNQALLRRLESFIIKLPPLRARREDIGLLLVDILKSNPETEITLSSIPSNLITELMIYDWPGNVRQLIHVFNRILLAYKNGEAPTLNSLIDMSAKRSSISSVASSLAPLDSTTMAQFNADAKGKSVPKNVGMVTERVRLAELSEDDVIKAMEKNFWTIQYAAQDLGISRPSMYKLLEANTQIRRAEQITLEELSKAIADCKGEVEPCASMLKTPSEALRRHLRGLGLIS